MSQSVQCQDLITAYLDWLRSKITVAEVQGVCEITTPFLDRHNDYIQIYVQPLNGGFRLTDDAYTIKDLSLSGCDLTSPGRRELLTTILNGFGVRQEGDELTVEARLETFPHKKHALLQVMLAVNDMFVTAQARVAPLFLEDVDRFLRLHKIRYTPNVQFMGKSRFVHNFDFVIPASPAQPERILRAINRPERNNVTAFLFSWNDTRDTRAAESTAYALLNDSEKPPSPDVRGALEQYGVVVVPWSRREDFAQQLAA